jgi:predicted enzyme related to lactoylglutathione lyase
MNKGIKTIIYPVKDLKKAKTSFIYLLGVEPHTDSPYYIGFKVEDQEIGLIPKGDKDIMTAFYTVDDISKIKQSLIDNGARIIQDVKNVGGGRLIASLRDPDENIIGLIQDT